MKDERGRILIEAAILMPLVMIVTLLLVGAGYMAFSRAELIQRTMEWTERAAFVWKDSHKDPVTGAFSYEEMDDIYSSMFSEAAGLFSSAFRGFRQAELRLPDGTVTGAGSSSAKLLRSSSGEVRFSGMAVHINRLVEGEVRAEWKRYASDPGPRSILFPAAKRTAAASSYISDPVDMLRTMELIGTYSAKLKSRFATPESMTEKLKGIIPGNLSRPAIRSEREAKAYIQQLVHGSAMKVTTPYGERHIDALDRDGIMHEAKYTVNKTDAQLQIQKDAELIRTGAVKGVVWHFFPVARTGKCDITPKLRKSLEDNGIMVVLHQ
ncbi:hypothetical protein [Gorillibacterium sp. sgz5001074]|uniref:hypothetical protein n=1 Tax=Gorillibacterium sp. sgz5001074 TaxID=3446695 RepID=UPI003F67A7F3